MRPYVKYIVAKYESWAEEFAYQIYMSNSIHMLSQSVVARFGGTCYNSRFYDFINPKPVETRTGDEVKAYIIKGLKEFVDESP